MGSFDADGVAVVEDVFVEAEDRSLTLSCIQTF